MVPGDSAYATITGIMEEDVKGFSVSEDGWVTVAYEGCGKAISAAILKLYRER